MDRGLSLNSTKSQVMESTQINGGSITNSFPWGVSTISPKSKNNVNSNLNRSNSLNKSLNRTLNSPMKTKIDPRVYADIKAKGLASRIAQYHEDNKRLPRSMSTGNVYYKTGQFPIVHLDGPKELPYKATRAEVSMTRIAPPKESMFYGNTISSLMRSSSIVGLQKTNEDLMHENRPILHPPPSESELAPTRSVIDVLQEISRKRINSDDPLVNENSKKSCTDDYRDKVDSGNLNGGLSYSTSAVASSATGTAISFKRQREQLNNPQQHLNGPQRYNELVIPSQAQQNSPEQIAKKRHCSYNNDISSSLSSSLILPNKRKLENRQSPSSPKNSSNLNNCNTGPGNEVFVPQKSKIIKCHQNLERKYETIAKTSSCNIPIQTLAIGGASNSSSPGSPGSINNVQVPFKTLSAPIYPSNKLTEQPSQPTKPKVTLFNTNYSKDTLHDDDEDDDTKDIDDDEGAGIQFIKPKKIQGSIMTKNPLIERTKQSKLAALLAGLKGELFQEDVVDSSTSPNKESQAATVDSNKASSSSTSSKVITGPTFATSVSEKPNSSSINIQRPISSETLSPIAKASVPVNPTSKAPSAVSSSSSTTNSAPALGGFQFKSPAMTSVTTSSTSTLPAFGGFPFNSGSTNASSNVASTQSTSTTTTAAVAAISSVATSNTTGLGTFSFPSATTKTAAAPSSNISFGTTSDPNKALGKEAFATSVGLTSSKETTSSGLNFKAPTTQAQSNDTASNTFNFKGPASVAAPPPATAAANPTNLFSFGKAKEPEKSESSIAPPQSLVKPSFSFGNNSSSTTTTSLFPSSVKDSQTAPAGDAVKNPPSLINNTTAAASNTSSGGNNLFAFGLNNNVSKPTAPAAMVAPFSFNNSNQNAGISSNQANNKALFAFGGGGGLAGNSANTSANPTSVAIVSSNNNTNSNGIFGTSGNAAKTEAPSTNTNSSAMFSFGSNNSAIGNNQTTHQNPSTNNIFGSQSQTSNTFPAPAPVPAPSQGSSIFGNSGQNGNSTAAAANNTQQVAFGGGNMPNNNGQNKPFTFGQSLSHAGGTSQQTNIFEAANNPQTNSTTNNIFGTAPANNANNSSVSVPKTFSFGSSSSNNNATNTFGSLAAASQTQSNTFSFGGVNNNSSSSNTNGPSASNVFGNSSSNEQNKPFAFGASGNSQTQNPFGQNPNPTTSNTTPFAFGGNNNNNSNSSSAASIFGGPPNTTSSQNKPFSFGGNNNNNNTNQMQNVAGQSNNIFAGGSSSVSKSPNPSPAFNFSAGNTNTIPANANPFSTNIMATPNSGFGDRLIRRATRRLQK